jgi:hypothetical protein
LSRLSRTQAADLLAGVLAQVSLRRLQGREIDEAILAKHHPYQHMNAAALARADMDTQFFAGVIGNPDGGKKVSRVLRNFENLDIGVRTGLLKTWLHTSLITGVSRDARFFRGGQDDVGPMDAIVAPFGPCNLRCRGCFYVNDLAGATTSPAPRR